MKHNFFGRFFLLVFFGFFLNFGLSSVSQGATVIKPSDLIKSFDYIGKKDVYNSINTNLHESINTSKKWNNEAVIGQFKVSMVLESDNYVETYTYITENNLTDAYEVSLSAPFGEWITQGISRDKTISQGIYRVPMRLRELVTLMSEDKELLSLLDRLYGNNSLVTEINFTLRKNIDRQLFWTVEISGQDSEKEHKTYSIQVNANSKVNPVFHLLRVK